MSCLLVAATNAEAGTSTRIPGTHVTLDAPADFISGGVFPGIRNAELHASVKVTENDESYADQLVRITDMIDESPDYRLLKSFDSEIGGRPARLMLILREHNDIEFEQWWGLVGNDSLFALIVASYPEAYSADMRVPMLKLVTSAQFDPEGDRAYFEGLNYRITPTEGLSIQDRIGTSLLLSGSKIEQPLDVGAGILVVSHSPRSSRETDLETFAKSRLASISQFDQLTIQKTLSLEVSGRPAIEIAAQATNPDDGGKLSIYSFLVDDGDSYYLFLGSVSQAQSQSYLPQYRAIARSLEIR